MAVGLVLVLLVLSHSCVLPVLGYGEPDANGHPNYQERANHVFLNAARIAPTQYRDNYMAGYSPSPASILGSTYPAVPPVYLEPKLDSSAFFHSNDMATNGCFSHPSCDGTDTFVRIKSYYTCSGTMGENIAAGYADPLDTSNQWLCDSTGSACAADGSGSDGHRSNMMSKNYKAVGIGYAYNSAATYRYYWTQDFGGTVCAPAPTSPVYGASHRVKSGSTSFIAVYYTNPATAPSSASVVINGQSSSLSLYIGAAGAGVYTFSQTAGTACRSYYFVFGSVRYPETGCLVTYGEGACATSFDATCGGTNTATTATTAATVATTAATTTTATVATTATTAATVATTATTAATVATTATTKPPTTAATVATTAATVSTTAAATTSVSTTGTGGPYVIYGSALQNSWVTQSNSGVQITNSYSYSGRTGLKCVFATTSGNNFLFFNHNPQVTNVWTTLSFYIAGSSSGNVLVYFNGGYYQTKAVTTAWQLYTIPLSSLANPSTGVAYGAFGSPNQLVFQNAGTTALTMYLNNVQLQ